MKILMPFWVLHTLRVCLMHDELHGLPMQVIHVKVGHLTLRDCVQGWACRQAALSRALQTLACARRTRWCG